MTVLAERAARVLFAHHLRERFRLGYILFMAARAQHGRIRQLRHHRSWIGGMSSKRAVAGFAVHSRVFARLLHFEHVAVALFASLVTGKRNRLRRKLAQCISTIVAVLPKALRNKVCPHQQKYDEHNRKRHCKPDQMFGVFK